MACMFWDKVLGSLARADFIRDGASLLSKGAAGYGHPLSYGQPTKSWHDTWSSTYFLASRDVLLCNVGQWVDFGEGVGAQFIGFGEFCPRKKFQFRRIWSRIFFLIFFGISFKEFGLRKKSRFRLISSFTVRGKTVSPISFWFVKSNLFCVWHQGVGKGSCQKRFSGFCPLRGFPPPLPP